LDGLFSMIYEKIPKLYQTLYQDCDIIGSMLHLYRRHSSDCKYAGTEIETKCTCPIWCDGALNGKRIRRATGLRDWARAQRKVEVWEEHPATMAPPESDTRTVEDAVKLYLADCAARKLAESSVDSYTNTLAHLTAFRPGLLVKNVTLELLTEFRVFRPGTPNTAIKELEHLRAFFGFCRDRKWVDENHALKLKRPKDPDCPTMPYEQEEVEKILAACDELRDSNPATREQNRNRARAMVLVMLYTGFRISDTMRLERRRVDMTTGKILIMVMKTGRKLYGRIAEDGLEALRQLEHQSGPYFFWNGQSKLRSIIGVARVTISRVLKQAGVEGKPHRFRDTFSVQLLNNGEDIRVVQQLLGHSSLRTTEKHYAPFVQGTQKILDTATAKLDWSIGQKKIHLVRSA
jgi:site-specific recombinase XerD